VIPRAVIVFELEAKPRLTLVSVSYEDERALCSWLERLDLGQFAADVAEAVAELRERRAA
jgi:hypothetical protein